MTATLLNFLFAASSTTNIPTPSTTNPPSMDGAYAASHSGLPSDSPTEEIPMPIAQEFHNPWMATAQKYAAGNRK